MRGAEACVARVAPRTRLVAGGPRPEPRPNGLTLFDGLWLVFSRNHVNGTVSITSDTLVDQIHIGSNVVHGSLFCAGNDPTENTGGSPDPRRVQKLPSPFDQGGRERASLRLVALSFLYRLVCGLLELGRVHRIDRRSKDAEIVVLRRQLAVLRR